MRKISCFQEEHPGKTQQCGEKESVSERDTRNSGSHILMLAENGLRGLLASREGQYREMK